MDSLFVLEPHLVQRLQDRLKALRPAVHVLTAADLAGTNEVGQPVPAVHLVYQGYRVLEVRADKRMARIEQTWLAVAAVQNVKGLKTGSEARADVGRLGSEVLLAFAGWKPQGASTAMALSNAPAARFGSGYQYLPQAFTVELVVG